MSVESIISESLLKRCLGKTDLAMRVLHAFAGQMKTDFAELQTSIGTADAVATTRIAHRIKGASGNAGLDSMTAAAKCIEALGSQARFEEIPEPWENLEAEWCRFRDTLAAVAEENVSSCES